MKKLIMLFTIFTLVSCNSDDSSTTSTDDGISTIPSVTADCRVNTICATGGDAVGKTGRVAFINGYCSIY